MNRVVIEEAHIADDPDLRGILADNPLDGDIRISLRRNPSFFESIKTRGNYNRIVIARAEGRIVGFGSRSIKPAYINGKVCNLGYLGDLRIDERFRGRTILARGYNYLKKQHFADRKALLYLTTIISENRYARDILTRKRAGLPSYHYFGDYCTFCVMLSPAKRFRRSSPVIVRGDEVGLENIVAFINRTGKEKQFYPFYTKEDFISDGYLKGFDPGDFYIATRDNRILGVVGTWSQADFKQIVVGSYRAKLRYVRPLVNAGLKLKGYPFLPPPGAELKSLYVSFIAIDKDDPWVFGALFAAVYEECARQGFSYVLLGFDAKDPLCRVISEFPHITYMSRLYVVCWEDGETFFNRLDRKTFYLELASL
jgi:hypothetical protein